jgi:hypothetical protein
VYCILLKHSLPKHSLPGSFGMRSQMLRRAKLVCAIAAFLCLPLKQASADIYQYTDKDGVIHFSNVGVGTGKKIKKVKSEQATPQYTPPASLSRTENTESLAQASMPPSDYVDVITNACDRHGVDPKLVHALVKVESDFNPYAMSRKGAMGLMQLMPQTASDMNVQNTFNPHENVDGGVRYLRYLIDRYDGNLSLALAAYNAGETAVKRWGTIPPFAETQNYVSRILKLYNGKGAGVSHAPHYTIFVGYSEDGAVTLTDDPRKQKERTAKRKATKEL